MTNYINKHMSAEQTLAAPPPRSLAHKLRPATRKASERVARRPLRRL